MKRALVVVLTSLLACCQQVTPSPHYVLGAPYQAGGVWYYPREDFSLRQTGLASVYGSGHPDLTADGEAFDQSVLAAGHQTVQLPAIARVTNLENGRQVVVRINDRGPATPHRVLEVTRRTANLLGFPPNGVVRVRVEVLADQSQAAVDAVPGAPALQIIAAPRGEVTKSDLPAPGSAAPMPAVVAPKVAASAVVSSSAPPLRLPEVVSQGQPDPGTLYVELSDFQNYRYANMQRARVAGLGARIDTRHENAALVYRVLIGPINTVQQADSVLDQVLAAGVTDARIVVE
ncbi:MAG TPA: septal ring lytic transglycosylase RlpA family protein [Acetobacteraceae bacterium]|nr:septal ring lytic transglycosylase RlpA family protein [Acetobacteraceae bacterium]